MHIGNWLIPFVKKLKVKTTNLKLVNLVVSVPL